MNEQLAAKSGMQDLPRVVHVKAFVGTMPEGDIRHTEFRDCVFRTGRWCGALSDVRFVRCRFEDIDWSDASLRDTVWEECSLVRTRWTNCNLDRPVFRGGDACEIELHACKVQFPTFVEVTWRNGSLDETRMVQWVASGSHFVGTRIRSGVIHDAAWAKSEFCDLRITGVDLQRVNFAQCGIEGLRVEACLGKHARWLACTMSDAVFKAVTLSQCSWSSCDWQGGAFIDSELAFPIFDRSELRGVRWKDSPSPGSMFDGARLMDCDLRQGEMPGMSLRNATLERVDLSSLRAAGLDGRGCRVGREVDMTGADFSNAVLIGQSKQIWSAGRLRGAEFEEASDVRDAHWWGRHAPGPRKHGGTS